MGEMQLDGSLNYQFSLGATEPLSLLGLHLRVAHRIDSDENGRARSVWHFGGLQTSLAPAGRETLRWKSPLGPTVDFEKRQIGPAFSHAGAERWLIRKTADGHEIRSVEGVSWHYAAGRLVEIEHPALGKLRVTTQGGWLTQIELSDAPAGAAPLLEASYSDVGRLRTLRIGAQAEQAFTWENGNLVAWENGWGKRRGWHYIDGLLSQIVEADHVREIRWQANKGFGRGDSRWVLPVHLAAVDGEHYGYTLTSRGFVLTRERRGEGHSSDLRVVTRFNPLRYRLEQWEGGRGGKFTLVIFRKASPGRGAVERIENAAREILEEYRYDVTGHLVGVRRRGEPPLDFGYDDLGRLIEMREEDPQ